MSSNLESILSGICGYGTFIALISAPILWANMIKKIYSRQHFGWQCMVLSLYGALFWAYIHWLQSSSLQWTMIDNTDMVFLIGIFIIFVSVPPIAAIIFNRIVQEKSYFWQLYILGIYGIFLWVYSGNFIQRWIS